MILGRLESSSKFAHAMESHTGWRMSWSLAQKSSNAFIAPSGAFRIWGPRGCPSHINQGKADGHVGFSRCSFTCIRTSSLQRLFLEAFFALNVHTRRLVDSFYGAVRFRFDIPKTQMLRVEIESGTIREDDEGRSVDIDAGFIAGFERACVLFTGVRVVGSTRLSKITVLKVRNYGSEPPTSVRLNLSILSEEI